MSLIVAKIHENNIRCLADTKVTDRNASELNSMSEILKAVILNHNVFIAYAGRNVYAEELLQMYYVNKIKDSKSLLYRCLDLHMDSKEETDFCVGLIINNQCKLFKISNSEIKEEFHNTWIGHIDAFGLYQNYYHNGTPKSSQSTGYVKASPSLVSEFKKMNEAFEAVIEFGSIPEVAHFVIPIETIDHQNKKHFIYGEKAYMELMPIKATVGSRSTPANFSNADSGGYGYSYLRSITIGSPSIAIYFPHGEFGLLFYPKKNHNNPIIIRNIPNGEEFAKYVKVEYNIILEGYVADKNYAIKRIGADQI